MSTLVSFTKSTNEEATEGAIYAMPATPLQVRLWQLNEAAPIRHGMLLSGFGFRAAGSREV